MLTDALMCLDSEPIFLSFFDLRVAPVLLFYAYIPVVIVSLFLGIFIFLKDKSLSGKLLLLLSTVFSLWVLDLIIQWISVYVSYDFFFWQTTPLLEISIPLILFYFVYTFLNKKDLKLRYKIFLSLPYMAMCILMPTRFNVIYFDLLNCEGVFGNFYYYIYAVEIIIIFLTGYISFKKYREEKQNEKIKKEALLIGIGSVLFLLIFTITNIYGEITGIYEINLLGPLGMVAFLILLTYLIIRYHSFNMKIIGTQALILSIIILIAATFFVEDIFYSEIIMAMTLVFVMGLGFLLIRSVKREVEQREKIERLASDLQKANDNQTELIRFITHQVKGFFTKSRMIFASLLDGDYGELPEKMRPLIEEGMRSDTRGVESVQQILHAANIRKGTIEYQKEKFDLKNVVEKEYQKQIRAAESKGLNLNLKIEGEEFSVSGDEFEISHAVSNLIDNAIKYTPSGSIQITLKKEQKEVIFKIEDTGIGIDEEDKKKLFTEGGRGKNSTKINVDSTGYGLYIVKNIIDSHNGRIEFNSKIGKGSSFSFFLPAKN